MTNLKPRLGFIGVGNIGRHLVRRLLENGYSLVLFDIRNEALDFFRNRSEVIIASSPAHIAQLADTVLVSLPTPATVKEVVMGEQGLLSKECRFTTFIDLSTTGPHDAKEIASELAARGIVALDAPVSGGVYGAKTGTLSIMVSGPEDAYAAQTQLLKLFGSKVFYVGPYVGQAQLMKLINNYLSAVAMVASSEAITLGIKGGLNPRIMLDVLNASSGRNSATMDKFPGSVLNRKFDYGFRTGLMYKDLTLCMSEADRLGVPLWVGNNIKEFWKLAQQKLGQNSDMTEIVRLFENCLEITIAELS